MKRQAGFTLLEILVALAVFGLVMVGLAQSLRFGLTAFRASGERGAMAERRAALDMSLIKMIETAEPASMAGRPGGVSFTTRLPAAAGVGAGLADVAVERAQGGLLLLVYRAHPPGIPLKPLGPSHQKILARDVTAFALSYYGAEGDQAPAWSGQWQRKTLPQLLRMHLRIGQGNWPDLVIAPDPQSG